VIFRKEKTQFRSSNYFLGFAEASTKLRRKGECTHDDLDIVPLKPSQPLFCSKTKKRKEMDFVST
jgi:hypothetical protein